MKEYIVNIYSIRLSIPAQATNTETCYKLAEALNKYTDTEILEVESFEEVEE